MYKSNIITQAWGYLMINLAIQRGFFLGISNMIYDRPSEMVPEQFFGLHVVVFTFTRQEGIFLNRYTIWHFF